MASRHISMWIDEDKTMLNISDHNLVRIWFKLGNDNHNIKKKIPRKRVTWISRNPVNILKCVSNLKARIGKKHNFKSCMEKLKTAVNHTMKKTKVQRLGGKENSFKRAAPWVDKELIENVNLRSKFSREWRYARKEGNEIKIKECKDKYYTQKGITASMVGDKKGGWEQKKITETLGDPAAFWRMIKLLLGKNKDNNEEAYIFDDEGEKTEIMNCKSEYLETWAAQVYQKLSKADFSFWSNTEGGEMQNMIRLMEEGNSGIMEDPIIEEKEFVDTINNMKNGKATGVDNIPAELMKALIKDSTIREYLLKCFNKALIEKVHKDWLVSRTTMIPKTNKPKILDHRPIAVTVNSNKIICTILRQKIEDFLETSGIKFENQFGFTGGGG